MMSQETKELTLGQKQRYNRHLILDGFGKEGQLRLLNAKVLVVGAGGLGSPVLMYLAAAGVGTLGIVDGDVVSISNLQRQIIHGTPDLDVPKVDSAEKRIHEIDPEVKVEKYNTYLTEDNVLDIVRDYDFVLECSDNFSTKYLVNDACIRLGKAFCIGGITRYSGQVMVHTPGTACYRCLFPEPPAEEDVEPGSKVGVLGCIAGMLGTVQATEAVKYLARVGEGLTNALLTFDALSMQWMRLDFCKNDSCSCCSKKINEK